MWLHIVRAAVPKQKTGDPASFPAAAAFWAPLLQTPHIVMNYLTPGISSLNSTTGLIFVCLFCDLLLIRSAVAI